MPPEDVKPAVEIAPAQAALPLEPSVAAAAPATPDPAPMAGGEPAPAAPPLPAEPPAKAAEPAVEPPADPAAAAKSDHPAEKPTLLEMATADAKPDVKADAKPDDKKPDAAAKAPDEKKPDAKADAKPAEPGKDAAKPDAKPAETAKPIEYKFELPEVMKSTKADDPQMTAFTAALGEFKAAPELGQKLLTMHADAMTEYAKTLREQISREQIDAFNNTRSEWSKRAKSDEQIGGAGHQTAMKAIARMRDMSVSDADPGTPQYAQDLNDYNEFLRITGAGDHPAYLKQIHRFARYFDEPSLPPENPQPPPDNGRPNGRRSRVMYDHPRSTNRQ